MRAFICGLAGTEISAQERAFFNEQQPWGLILFARNVADPDQLRSLTAEFREITGRGDAPILIDQEGGRVRRLRPPHWQNMPAAGAIRELHMSDERAAKRAAWLSGRLIGEDLFQCGINVDCFPVCDLLIPGAHDIVGDRSYGESPQNVVTLAGEAAAGLRAAGVSAIMKHIPGHGRAHADSHLELPVVDTPEDRLEATDFEPFRGLNSLPMAMTAHVVYTALDAQNPATTSSTIIGDRIRGTIGFEGLLMSDDLSMKALSGMMAERTSAVFSAGCDMALHCNGEMDEMRAVADHSPELVGQARIRAEHAMKWPQRVEEDCAALRREFVQLLGLGGSAVGA